MKHILTLTTDGYPHVEEWYLLDDKETIYVKGSYPNNYPTESEHDLTIVEALCQYAMMTSTEGWTAEDDGWHDFIDEWQWRWLDKSQ